VPIKKVYVASYHPVAAYPDYEQTWCDVWLRFHAGRKSMRTAPTLRSASDLAAGIELDTDFAKEYPQYRDETLEYVTKCEKILVWLESHHFYCDETSEPQPDIFTARETINRAEAEAMIDYYLSQLGVKNAVQKWMNPGKNISRPVTVLDGMII
jgi:hypothetical protein